MKLASIDLVRFVMLATAFLKHTGGLFRGTSRYHICQRNYIYTRVDSSRSRSNQRLSAMLIEGIDGIPHAPVDYAETVAKRKIALTLAYVGTNYFGLQMDPNTIDLFPTVEGELERALYEIGCIAESNKRAPSKIGWSRSSRTDKGVHCARLVISVKLEVKLGWLKGRELRVPDLVEKLNAKLPSDIRVLSCCKINQGFRAKEACSWREYEYLLPTSMLFSGMADHEGTKERFMACLKAMEGTQSFHNFHRLSAKDLKGRQLGNDDAIDAEGEADEGEGEGEGGGEKGNMVDDVDAAPDVETSSASSASSESHMSSPAIVRPSLHETWEPALRTKTETTRGIIFAFEVVDNEGLDGRALFVRIRIRGQSFLLHQIRLMVSAAVLVARDVLPRSAIDMTLLSPFFINLPLAPAEGLVLINAGFDRNSNRHTIAMFRPPVPGEDINPGEIDHQKEEGHEVMTDESPANDTLFLLTRKEFQDSERFKHEQIYVQMKRDWEGMDTRNGLPLVTSWLLHAEKYRASTDVRSQWDELAVTFRAQEEAEEATRREKETLRLQRNLVTFRESFPGIVADSSGKDGAVIERGGKEANSGNKRKQQPLNHKKLLPNSISTAIINRFRIMPGDAVLLCQRALATAMVEGKIPISSSTDDICNYMESNGGFYFFSSNEPYRHPYIE